MSWFSSLKKNKQEAVPELTDVLLEGDAPKAKPRKRSKAREDQNSDPALPEKKRARRRLVGAIVMTLALVIALPMLLDAEPQPVSREINVQVHAKHKLNQPDDDKLAQIETSSAVAPSESPQPADKTEEPPQAKTVQRVEHKPAVKTVDKVSHKSAAQPPKKTTQKTPAKVATAKIGTSAAKNQYMIQVAALSSMDSVKELRVQLAIAGYKSHIQKVTTNNGERIRVRVGPYDSRQEAQKACPKLSTMKLRCLLVTNW